MKFPEDESDLMQLFFQILMIALVSAPVVALAVFLYLQLYKYVKVKNKEDRLAGRK